MLKFTSASGSGFRATTATDITLTVTIIRTGIIIGRTMEAITIGHTTTVAIDITGTIIPTTITGANVGR
jgi:hypothetical protein